MAVNEKVGKIIDLAHQAVLFSEQNNLNAQIACLEDAISLFKEIPFQENIGIYKIYSIYYDLARAIGVSGEELRKKGYSDEALEKDFKAISLMETAIEYGDNAHAPNAKYYKKDLIIACMYIAMDLLKRKDLNKSIEYAEKIVKYAVDISLGDIKKTIHQIADNYDKNIILWIEKDLGKDGVNAAVEISGKLRHCTRKFLRL